MSSESKHSKQNCMVEWSFSSKKEYADPFNEVEVSAVFIEPGGEEKVVPAFWAGRNVWRVRYASYKVGKHYLRTVCSDTSNPDLHSQERSLEVIPYTGENPLFQHGPLKVSQDRRYLEHVGGKPFFWLGDTWWMGLVKRLKWTEGFKFLTADRVKKGFTVIQIVAGLYPDMAPFDPRGANEAGFPWEEDYSRINPTYFDMADRRIDWLVKNGLVPCIVGSWGYFIEFAGEETMKKHWRNLVARYGAYPVVWCVAGEALMAYHSSPVLDDEEKLEEYEAKARASWTRVTRYLRLTDPYRHPITIHPTAPDASRQSGPRPWSYNMVDDPSVIDVDMLQAGHGGLFNLPYLIDEVVSSTTRSRRMPRLVGEACYEGIAGWNWENVQRLMFWTSILNGAAGHTYGAIGTWEAITQTEPYGSITEGQSYGDTPWEEAYQFPGSRQVGLGKRLLERYPWWKFEPHRSIDHLEWVEPWIPLWTKPFADYIKPYAAGVPEEVYIIYIPPWHVLSKVKKIEQGITYRAFWFDPRNGREYNIGTVVPDEKGDWQPPKPPIYQDWVLVMEAKL